MKSVVIVLILAIPDTANYIPLVHDSSLEILSIFVEQWKVICSLACNAMWKILN